MQLKVKVPLRKKVSAKLILRNVERVMSRELQAKQNNLSIWKQQPEVRNSGIKLVRQTKSFFSYHKDNAHILCSDCDPLQNPQPFVDTEISPLYTHSALQPNRNVCALCSTKWYSLAQ